MVERTGEEEDVNNSNSNDKVNVTIQDIAKTYEATIDSLNIVKESSIDEATGKGNLFANVVSSEPIQPKSISGRL